MSRTFTLSVAVNTIEINAGYALTRHAVVVVLHKGLHDIRNNSTNPTNNTKKKINH